MITDITPEEFPYCAVYNYGYYREHQPDLDRAFGEDRTLYLRHFVEHGMKEGRKANPNFDVMVYRTQNPDLSEEFGDDLEKYFLHYIEKGQMEKRKVF